MSLGSDKPRARLPMGHIDVIENKNKKDEEPARWARIRLEYADGTEGTFLFTFQDTMNALSRAYTQSEDLAHAGKVKLGHVAVVSNANRKEGEPETWAHTRLRDEDGSENTFLFSLAEIEAAAERTVSQSEDLPPKGILQKLQDLLD